MEGNTKIKTVQLSVYQRIAADIAAKIAEKQYLVGDKIYARSSIASQYAVSPETARKAICILADMEIVSATKGSGVTILSSEKAALFLQQFNDVQTINNLKKELLDNITRQKEGLEELSARAAALVENVDRFKVIHPFTPFEMELSEKVNCLGKTLGELHFWQHTAATVIAIRKGETTLISPGPYATLNERDVLYFIGDETSLDRVQNFLFAAQRSAE